MSNVSGLIAHNCCPFLIRWRKLPTYNSLMDIFSTPSPSGVVTDPCSFAFKQWNAISDQLAVVIKDYVDACTSLAFVLSQPHGRYSNKTELDHALVSLSKKLPSLAQDETRLLVARAKLNVLRNQSRSLCPISNLHPEILSRIFILSCLSCVHGHGSHKNRQFLCPVVFANVCTSWRQIAIGTGRLWSHIDLAPNSNPSYKLYKRARIWLDRAGNTSLHIHVHERSCAKDEDIAQLVKFLSLHMKRLCTLYIDTECYTLDLFESILECWLEHGLPGSIKNLVLRRPNPIPLLSSLGPQELRRLPRERLGGFLQPLRALHLHNVCMGWDDNTAHQGLVELQLESLAAGTGPTIHQLLAVLLGCPRLQKLKLARVNFRDEDAEELPSVRLTHLRELNLLSVNARVLKLLLPTLETGSDPLAMSITLGAQVDILEELKSFLGRSNLFTLYIDAQHLDWVPLLFGCLQHLQTLVIGNSALSNNLYVNSTANAGGELTQGPAICASLRSLSFVGCDLNLEASQNMLKAHPTLKVLNLWRCKLRSSDVELNNRDNLFEIVRPILTNLVPLVTHSSCPKQYPMLGWYVSDEHDANAVNTPS